MGYIFWFFITIFIILLIIALLMPKIKKKLDEMNRVLDVEEFENPAEIKEDKIDKLYCKLYDQVFNEPSVYAAETKSIIDFMNKHPVKTKKKEIMVLDAGTGTGKHFQNLASAGGYKIVGVDRSKVMEDIFKIRNPLGSFVMGDLRNEDLFKAETFSYICCLKETLYHNSVKEWDAILSNFFYWLKPEGYLIIHIYDRTKLDPAPRNMSFLRHDAKKRKHSITHFPKFTHDAWWDVKGKTICQYNEIYAIRGENSEIEKKRHYKHNLVMPDKDKIMDKILRNYFKLINVVKMDKMGLIDHELCFFKKNKF